MFHTFDGASVKQRLLPRITSDHHTNKMKAGINVRSLRREQKLHLRRIRIKSRLQPDVLVWQKCISPSFLRFALINILVPQDKGTSPYSCVCACSNRIPRPSCVGTSTSWSLATGSMNQGQAGSNVPPRNTYAQRGRRYVQMNCALSMLYQNGSSIYYSRTVTSQECYIPIAAITKLSMSITNSRPVIR